MRAPASERDPQLFPIGGRLVVSPARRLKVVLAVPLLLLATPAALGDDGDLDPTFGNAGIVHTGILSTSETDVGLAIQVDGKILLAGHSESAHEDFVGRFDASGVIDPDFGSGGFAYPGIYGSRSAGLAVAIQTDGKILLAGVSGSIHEAFVARLGASGALDPSFGSGGVAYTGFYCFSSSRVAVAVQTDGKILLAGNDGQVHENFIARFDASGALDPSFGSAGVARTGFLSSDEAGIALTTQANDGKILLAGHDGPLHEVFVARFNPDGSYDTAFGSGGLAHTGFYSSDEDGIGLALQIDGKILLAGRDGAVHEDFVARFDATGTLDPSFGSGGVARTGFLSSPGSGVAVAIQADGKVLLGGHDSGPIEDFVARFDEAGVPDPSFGSGGIAYTGLLSAPTSKVALSVQTDGKILLAGNHDGPFEDFIARFIATGASQVLTGDDAPHDLVVGLNCPNPFSSSTAIPCALSESGQVRAAIYDVDGHLVRTLVEGRRPAGTYVFQWNGRDRLGNEATAGVYFVRLGFAGKTDCRRIVLAR